MVKNEGDAGAAAAMYAHEYHAMKKVNERLMLKLEQTELAYSVAMKALKDIKRHQEVMAGNMAKVGMAWTIADHALKYLAPPETTGKAESTD